jgi:abhydrolase domain-containing protein 6
MRLFALATHVGLRAVGFRRLRRRLGDWNVVFYRHGRGGEPLLLLHGLGSNALSWSPVARRFGKRDRLIVPELSAIGGTRGPRAALDIRDGARVLAELLRRELAGEPATIVGLSLGGWMAVRLALEAPALVSRLILIDAAGYREQDWEAIKELVTVSCDADVDRLYAALFQSVPRLFRLSRGTFRKVFSSAAVTCILDRLTEDDLYGPEDLARLEVPVGVIWAEHDGLFSASVGRELASHLRHGRFYLVEGVGHALHWELPAALLDALERCRAELPAGAPGPVAVLPGPPGKGKAAPAAGSPGVAPSNG